MSDINFSLEKEQGVVGSGLMHAATDGVDSLLFSIVATGTDVTFGFLVVRVVAHGCLW